MVAVEEKYRFTVEEYYRMGEIGIFPPDVRVELVDGLVRRMPPIHPPHASIVDRLNAMLAARLAGVALLRVQGPIHLDDYNEPQPDLTVMRFRDDYSRQHPTPADVLLAIEVADTSLSYDRDEKIPRYGRAGIPESWLVDVQAGTIRVFTEPHAGGYGQERVVTRGQEIMSVAVEGLRLQVDEALG
ncbi:MAG: Uma2 family endonuclease [Chloroflexota bacterium]|nr:Uma2 family endonuclease [Chloroflexota bacterium]